MRNPFKRKADSAKKASAAGSIDPAAMSLLMRAFREVLSKRWRGEWAPTCRVTPSGAHLITLDGASAYLIAEDVANGDRMVVFQGGRGTPAPVDRETAERVSQAAQATGTLHLYVQSWRGETATGIAAHIADIDPFKLIPDLFRKARSDRALLQALRMLGPHV